MFSKSLKRAREQAKKTVRELSALAGVPASSITNIENGKGNPTQDTLEKLGNALGMEWYLSTSPIAGLMFPNYEYLVARKYPLLDLLKDIREEEEKGYYLKSLNDEQAPLRVLRARNYIDYRLKLVYWTVREIATVSPIMATESFMNSYPKLIKSVPLALAILNDPKELNDSKRKVINDAIFHLDTFITELT